MPDPKQERHFSLTTIEVAHFLAAKAIAAATSFLDGRSDGAVLARAADQLMSELAVMPHEPDTNLLLDPTRMLVSAMMHAAIAVGPRQQRWRCIMLAFVDLVRTDSMSLRNATAPRRYGFADSVVLRQARAH